MSRYIRIALVAVALLAGVGSVSAEPITTISPADKSTEYLTIPYFAWKDVPSKLPYPGYYRIEVATDRSFKDVIDKAALPAMINHYSPNFELDYGKTYYWRIAYTKNKDDRPGWNKVQSFALTRPKKVIRILSSDRWKKISGKFQQAVDLSKKKQAVELLFPKNRTFYLKQLPMAEPVKGKKKSKKKRVGIELSKGKYLFAAEGATNIVINGNGSKLILEKDPEESVLGLFKLTSSSHIQLKNLTVDFAKNSVGHFGGVISKLDKNAGSFTVTVDPKVYANFAEIKEQEASIRKQKGKVKDSTHGVFFKKQGSSMRVPSSKKDSMKQTWTEAQDKKNPNLFHFTKSEKNDSFDDIARNLENGDLALTGFRGGDLISMGDSTHMVFNNLTSYGARNRMFIPGDGSKYIRLMNCRFLKRKDRHLGAAAGGIGIDASHYPWIEGNRFEGCHDDTYHSQPRRLNDIDSVLVYKNNELVAGYRHSIWLNGDRNWVVGNRIRNGGLYGIKLGRSSPKNSESNNNIGYQVSGAIIEDNLIENVLNHGLTTQTGLSDPVSGKYNEYITIRNNTVVDVSGGNGYDFSWIKNSIVENNLFRTTAKRILKPDMEEPPKAFCFKNAINVKGKGNRVEDPELKESDRLLIEGSKNVNVEVLK